MLKYKAKRLALLISSLLVVSLVMVACGDSTATPATQTTAAATSAAVSTAAAATTAAPATTVAVATIGASTTAAAGTAAAGTAAAPGVYSKPTTIRWWSWKPIESEAKALIDDFNKQQPNIKIDYKFFQYSDYVNALKLEMLSGNGPDIFFGQSGAFLKQYQEFTQDLQPYVSKTYGADWEKKFYPIGLSEIKETGKIAGLPWMLLGAGYVWYNNTIFKKYNLTPPKTYAEFVQVSSTLKSNGVTPFVQGAKDNWINFDTFMAIANQIAPGKVYDAEAGKIPWTDPDLVTAMNQWKKLFDDGIMQQGALGIQQYPDANDLFLKGQAAMIIQGTWANNNMTKTGLAANKKTYSLTQDFEFLPFLFPDVNGDGQPATLTAGPDSIMLMNSNSKEKDAVWIFMQYLLSDAVQLNTHAKKGIIPAIQGIPLDPTDISTDPQKTALATELKDFNAAKGKREFAYPETQAALGTALQNVASGQAAAKDALAEVEKASQKIKR